MRILFVSLAVPYPPTNGHRIRNWILLRALTEEGHDVDLVTFADAGEASGDARRFEGLCRRATLVPAPAPPPSRFAAYGDRLRALLSTVPYGVRRFRSAGMREAVRRALREPYECVLCDDIYNVENVAGAGGAPALLNKHDLTHVIMRRFAGFARNPFERAYAWLEHRKLKRWEARSCGRFAGVLACSEEDRSVLRALAPDARVEIVPNAIDAASYPRTPDVPPGPPIVLYFGSMDWYPNVDAVGYFADHVLPELRRRVPDVRFRIAGRNPPEALFRRLRVMAGVEFAGGVEDMRTEIAAATVCVVPLRIGSGTRLKILEAGAMEKAIVSTRIGAEGLDFEHEVDIVLEDEPAAFAAAVAALCADPERRQRLGRAARQRVERDYSLPAVRAAFRRSLPRLLDLRPVDLPAARSR